MKLAFACLFFLICLFNTNGQNCKQTGTVVFIRNTGIVRSFIGKIYINDSLTFHIKHHECQTIELPEGIYTLKCSHGNTLEGFNSHTIRISVQKGGITFIQFIQNDVFGGSIPGNSKHSLKMVEVTKKKTLNKLLNKKFVRKRISKHLLALFILDQTD